MAGGRAAETAKPFLQLPQDSGRLSIQCVILLCHSCVNHNVLPIAGGQ